ncbi:retinol dehydrogenase 11-like [Helicoverpa zea]|uniref:retinol dehydrogenase 11-like n=1 Tax=Helicoverpa zea TaxID=7113 RepID=UPI001F56F85A|nr:retinol dehydrogenase 11-like [Helicoverpa zea]
MAFLISFVIINIIVLVLLKVYFKLTTGICKSSKHLVGKVAIVTGGNKGIGYETCKDFAERGARVIIACRSERLGTAARDTIVSATGNDDVHFKQLDLSSLASVRAFAEGIIKNEKRLDILVNNAGVYEVEHQKTEDGLSLAVQTNHFGPFLLTNLLLPLLKSSAPSRIVNVSSIAHSGGKVELDNLNLEKETKETYSMSQVYQNTKLFNVLMTVELARRLEGTGVTANSLHPGVVATDILFNIKSIWVQPIKLILSVYSKTPWEGAQTTVHLAVSREVEDVSGKYYRDCHEASVSSLAQDKDMARKLWDASEKLVGLK